MSSFFPNGTIFSIGTTYGAAKAISALSNANPAVAQSTAHGFTTSDIVVVASGWPALNGAAVRVGTANANDFALEGVNTLNLQQFAAGQGVGSAREVTDWVALSQVTGSTTSGGEQQFNQWQYLEEGTQRQRPTVKSARSMTITMDYDPSLPWHAALLAADQLGTPHVIRAAMPSGRTIYYSMYVAYDGEPSFDINTNQQVTLSLAFDNPRSRAYAA